MCLQYCMWPALAESIRQLGEYGGGCAIGHQRLFDFPLVASPLDSSYHDCGRKYEPSPPSQRTATTERPDCPKPGFPWTTKVYRCRNLQETTRSLVGNLLSLFQLQLLPRAVHSQHHLSGQACSPANQISDASTAGLGRQGFLDTFFGCVRGGHQEGPIRVSQGFQPSHFPCVKGASTVSAHCIKMEEPKDQGELCVSHPTSEDVAHSPVDLAHPNGVDTIGWRLGWTLPLSVGVVDSEETLSTRAFIHEKTGTLELNDCCKWGQRRLVNEPCQCNSGLFPALRSIDAEPHHARIAWIRPDQTGSCFPGEPPSGRPASMKRICLGSICTISLQAGGCVQSVSELGAAGPNPWQNRIRRRHSARMFHFHLTV
ncbi:hypothetical protein VFPPC_17949 [Pochonia chlamydosporia 170]|uniref:Uncharacterized protein n=1 Tax=Pochonia chlamydosporia 170 TaxID=1380566 RepID=A0A219APX5_METCM|nr:hypothetical protein VFPPC_17949 [Pochonia chlamydosporia 170]OWT42858.1 hypothetical protein VFPPC_17949 [Pochonia chlamydosporia 170]